MLIAAGNINEPYETLGIVHAVVTREQKSSGCGGAGGLPIQEAYEAVTASLAEAAGRSGADGLIHVHYDYRLSSRDLGCNTTAPVFEVYGWGTAVKLRSHDEPDHAG